MEVRRPHIAEALKKWSMKDNALCKADDFIAKFPVAEKLNLNSYQLSLFREHFALYALRYNTRRVRGDVKAVQRVAAVTQTLEERIQRAEENLRRKSLKDQLERNKREDFGKSKKHFQQLLKDAHGSYERRVQEFVNDEIQRTGNPARIMNAANTLARTYLYTRDNQDKSYAIYEMLDTYPMTEKRPKGPFEE